MNTKSPSRKVMEIDNRGSHYYLALYWAEALTEQKNDPEMSKTFENTWKMLAEKEAQITDELIQAQGEPVNIGGYYQPDENLAKASMRPSTTLNEIITSLAKPITTD